MHEPWNASERSYAFGRFRLVPAQQLLLEDDAPVRLGSRAFEILTALVERSGTLVPKKELMARAWPRTVVEESNLKVTVAALRRALGEDRSDHRFLVNVPGRGYRFVAPVQCTDGLSVQAESLPHDLPNSSTRIVGRADVVAMLARVLPERRFMSIVGSGGIGKTTVAVAVAQALAPQFEHGARFVDLSPVADSRVVPLALAKSLGLTIHSEDVVAAVVMAVRQRRLLIVLDSCEHVLQGCASLAERILAAAPDVVILTTTREPLRARGEIVYRLAPLASPPDSSGLTAEDALAFPAVKLFVERASACLEDFRLTDHDAPVVAGICRKLEGIALAIELTATRVDTFALRELSALLDDRFRMLHLDRRSAFPRHRSLAAALDWSHDLLQEDERVVLRRLSVFAGLFRLAAAQAIAGADCDAVAALDGLVAKSLVSADVGGAAVQYRLLDTMRAYAAQKLLDSGEQPILRRRHAQYQVDVLARSERESDRRQSLEWAAEYGRCLDDVRSALGWCFSPEGDGKLAVDLTIAAIPLWTQLSMLEDCRTNVEKALACERPGHALSRSDRMKLCAALGMALLYTRGPQSATEALWTEALEIADETDDIHYQLRMLWGLPVYMIFIGNYRGALHFVRRLRHATQHHGDSVDRLCTERLLATTLQYLGRQTSARKRLDHMLRAYAAPVQQSHILRFQFDQRAAAQVTLASTVWLQGSADQAIRIAQHAIDDGQAAGHPISLCNALGHAAIPISVLVGDIPAAERHLQRLFEHQDQFALTVWRSRAAGLQGILMIERSEAAGVQKLREAITWMRTEGFCLRHSFYLCALARGHALAGDVRDAIATVDEALAWCDKTGERWFQPEALRLKGEFIRQEGTETAMRAASQLYEQAIGMARRQGALAWELRAATSLAELHLARGRHAEALDRLQSVERHFVEGFRTADLRRSKALLAQLASPAPRAAGVARLHSV